MRKKLEQGMLFVVGLCLGGIIGLFSAPTGGGVMRRSLVYSLKNCQKKLRRFIVKLVGNKQALSNQAKNMGEALITDVVCSAEKILQELDALTRQVREEERV